MSLVGHGMGHAMPHARPGRETWAIKACNGHFLIRLWVEHGRRGGPRTDGHGAAGGWQAGWLAHRPWHPAAAEPGHKDSTGQNACEFGNLGSYFETYFGAMNKAQFGGSCGKCVAITGATRRRVVVKIVDECPECAYGDIDLSTKVRA